MTHLLSLSNTDAVRRNFRVSWRIKGIVNELAADVDPRHVTDIIESALAFPVHEEVGGEDRFWPEPFDSLRVPVDDGLKLSDAAQKRVDQLIELVPGKDGVLGRLLWLAYANLLTSSQKIVVARRLWGNSETLPNVAPASPIALLALPEPRAGVARQAVSDWFLATPPPNLRSPDGSISFGAREWFEELCAASTPYRNARSPSIDWSVDEAKVLLQHAEAWWQGEGKELTAKRRNEPFFIHIPGRRLHHLVRSVARAIAPVLPVSSAEGKARLPKLLNEIAEVGYPVLSALPLLLRYKIGDAEETAAQLIEGLYSKDSGTVEAALWGIIHWREFQKTAKLPALPHRLIEKLLIFVAARADGSNATDAVGTIEAILGHVPTILSTRAKELLELALDGLQGRAAYPPTWHQRDGQRYANIVPLRQNAVLLASVIHRMGLSQAAAVQDWLEIGRSDPLPIVRQSQAEGSA